MKLMKDDHYSDNALSLKLLLYIALSLITHVCYPLLYTD